MYKTKICKLCGKEFTPRTNTQAVCDDQHYRNCSICGKSFELQLIRGRNLRDLPKTCSKECATKLKFKRGFPMQSPEAKKKAKITLQKNYGVDHPMHSQKIKDKLDNTMQAKYGVRRYTQTPEYIDKAIATNQEKYGTDWPMQAKDVQEKSTNTLMEHYGITNPMKSKDFIKKAADTYKSHTGYDYSFQNPEVKEQIKQNNLEKYGVEYTSQVPEIQAKAKATMVDRYGAADPFNSPVLSEKIRKTNLERYGVDIPSKSPEVQEKISNTMMVKYGVSRYSQTSEHRATIVTNPSKLKEWNKFLENPISYVNDNFKNIPTYKELAEHLGVTDSTIIDRIPEDIRVQIIQSTLSYMENEIVEYLQLLKPDIIINRHNRKLIYPQEIDIYLPEYQLGIEVNPTITHNSTYSIYGDKPKAPSYHKHKTDVCEIKGIFLFHIFGYEWDHKQDIIKSMLCNLIGCNTNKIYARKCEIRKVENKDAISFLNANHRQGEASSKVRLGLYYQNELVSLMTFGKLRNTIGQSADNKDCWELVRFASKLNTTVIGGADKLFKSFIQQYNPNQVRSFSDRSHTKGKLYEKLGFIEIRRSNANYVWVNKKTNIAYNRLHTQKRHIKQFLCDDDIDLSLSEKQIMEDHGFVQVFDSGTITWEWQN